MYSFLYPTKNIIRTTLLDGMTDIHTHLLPGVDDGFDALDKALEMLSYFQQVGVRRIYLTPHVSDEYPNNTPSSLRERHEQLADAAPEGVELRLAAEYMLDAGFRKRLSEGLLAFPGNRVLVETSYLGAPLDFFNLLYDLSLEGYTPVLAHPERYAYMTEVDYYLLKSKGYKFQMNLFSLSGLYGSAVRRNAQTILKRGFYDYVGSDCHDRDTYKMGIKNMSLERYQIEELRRLLDNNKSF